MGKHFQDSTPGQYSHLVHLSQNTIEEAKRSYEAERVYLPPWRLRGETEERDCGEEALMREN